MHIKTLLLCFAFALAAPKLLAQTLVPLKVLPQNQGVVFKKTSALKPKVLVLVYKKGDGPPLPEAILEVTVCNEKLCKGVVKKQRKNSVLSSEQIYSLRRLTEKPRETVVGKEAAETLSDLHSAHLSYGGPIPTGVSVTYLYHKLSFLSFGLSAGIFNAANTYSPSEISASTAGTQKQELGLSGQQVSLIAQRRIIPLPLEFSFTPVLQIGLIRAEVNFNKFLGPKVSHLGPFVAGGMDLNRNWGNFILTLGAGLSYNFIQDFYFDSSGSSFKTPYSGSLFFWKLGGGWQF